MGSGTAAAEHPVDRVKDGFAASFLREVWDEIERCFYPEHVILFGSRASGHPRPDSDIDLIIVSPYFQDIRFIKRMGIVRDQLECLRRGISVDILCYTPEEFEVMGTGIGMVAEAAKEGIWLR